MKFLRSRHLVRMRISGNRRIVYHSLFGNPITISGALSDLLDRFQNAASIKSVLSVDEIPFFKSALAEFKRLRLLVEENRDEYAELNRGYADARRRFRPLMESGRLIDKLRLELTASCNFSCRYCFAHKIYDANHATLMSFETARRAVDGYLGVLRRGRKKQGAVTFWGGEPLLNWDVMRRTVDYAQRSIRGTSRVLEFGVVTNGSLIRDGIARFMKKHAIRVTVSLDGIGEANDCFRQYADGRGTYKDIIRGMDCLRRNGVGFWVEITLHDRNFNRVEDLILFLREKYGVGLFIVCPVYHQRSGSGTGGRYSARDKARRMLEIYRFGVERHIRINVEDLEIVNVARAGIPQLFVCSGKFSTVYVKPDGRLCPCQKLTIPIGDVNRIDAISCDVHYRRTASRGIDRITGCRGCDIEGFCAGGCAGLAQFYSGDMYDTSHKDYQRFHCAYKRHLFKETLRYLSTAKEQEGTSP